ncbi:protein WEAK CHLOROPLAST MOVEMENT UNDER BLUE LIGHT 1-like isoform X1 [Typha angustifolia]|uniref:protein WEAK CHLOROPLAST MOVEMENT UNDER BLUE LIGHT 1-like isoform X1 n=2 Tax=Typha angustifolia TaxID=59011 RepID=UPI003C306369
MEYADTNRGHNESNNFEIIIPKNVHDGSSENLKKLPVAGEDAISMSSLEASIEDVEAGDTQNAALKLSENLKGAVVNRSLAESQAPFESVKVAVSKFGGVVDWKSQKNLTLEKHKTVQLEIEKVQEGIPEYRRRLEASDDNKEEVLKEMENTKRLIEELKLSLENAKTQEAQAKQDSEIAELSLKETKQGITENKSIAVNAQIDVSNGWYLTALSDLKSVKRELEELQRQYLSLITERDVAIREAEESTAASEEIEKNMEDLKLELITAREFLESAHAAHIEAEEKSICSSLSWEKDKLRWENELKQAEDELQQLNEQLLLANDLESKLEKASTLLLNLKAELASNGKGDLDQEPNSIDGENEATLAQTLEELKEVKANIEKAKDEVMCLRVAATSLNLDLEREKAALTTLRQREVLASLQVSSLEAKLSRTNTKFELILVGEKEARDKMVDLPKELQQAAMNADQAKSVARLAHEELRKAKEEAEQAKAGVSTLENRLNATLKEIEAAKESQKLASAAVKALEESEQVASMRTPFQIGVSLPLEEYYTLSKKAHETEELANKRVISAIEQIKAAKEFESRRLEKLEEANKKMEESKKALRLAIEKADKARSGKLATEEELRKWRAGHEQQRKSSDAAQGSDESSNSEEETDPGVNSLVPRTGMPTNAMVNAIPEPNMRRRSLFPQMIMLLARKKAQPSK